MSRYDDIEEAKKRIDEEREFVRKLSDEDYASIDVNTQIKSLEFRIKWDQERLADLKEIAKDLPMAKRTDIDQRIIDDCRYRFRGRRDVERKLYKKSEDDGGW